MTGRLKHPEHGFHHPMPGEAEGMLKNGWAWEIEEVPAQESPAAPPDPQPVTIGEMMERASRLLEAADPVKRKPGRPRKDS